MTSPAQTRSQYRIASQRERATDWAALALLLLFAGLAIAGPGGLLAWGEKTELLDRHRMRIAALTVERDELQNQVDLLDPRGADPDFVVELLRRNQNMVHPDEMILTLPSETPQARQPR